LESRALAQASVLLGISCEACAYSVFAGGASLMAVEDGRLRITRLIKMIAAVFVFLLIFYPKKRVMPISVSD
jgi:hypothetical protein